MTNERRDAACQSAMRATVARTLAGRSDALTEAETTFRAVAAHATAGIDTLFSAWSALRVATAEYAVTVDSDNRLHPDRAPRGVSARLTNLTFAEVIDQVLAKRVAVAGQLASSAISDTSNAADAATPARVK
jgi:hypothetical protein